MKIPSRWYQHIANLWVRSMSLHPFPDDPTRPIFWREVLTRHVTPGRLDWHCIAAIRHKGINLERGMQWGILWLPLIFLVQRSDQIPPGCWPKGLRSPVLSECLSSIATLSPRVPQLLFSISLWWFLICQCIHMTSFTRHILWNYTLGSLCNCVSSCKHDMTCILLKHPT